MIACSHCGSIHTKRKFYIHTGAAKLEGILAPSLRKISKPPVYYHMRRDCTLYMAVWALCVFAIGKAASISFIYSFLYRMIGYTGIMIMLFIPYFALSYLLGIRLWHVISNGIKQNPSYQRRYQEWRVTYLCLSCYQNFTP